MTRINLIPVQELSDQHLIAEYRELPRVCKQKINIDDASDKYLLGKGHVKWCRKHLVFVLNRYYLLCSEMRYRGFTVNYEYDELLDYLFKNPVAEEFLWKDYEPTEDDITLSRNRIISKIKMKPNWYKWTNRDKPEYVEKECRND